jgi:hypothetical protein
VDKGGKYNFFLGPRNYTSSRFTYQNSFKMVLAPFKRVAGTPIKVKII